MAVRRLHAEQPATFAFTPDNLAWAKATIAKYPPGKEASAVIPILWRAQEQEGWCTEPAIRAVAEMLGMAYIRVYEVATFYTMFQLSPVGSVAHVQVCGTTPCMLRGAEDLVGVCKRRIAHEAHQRSADGRFSWEEVECLGSCANAPMVQIGKDTYEDLTPESFERVLDGFASGNPPKPGSQTGRTASCPEGGPTTLTDPTLYDGSTIGAWQKRFAEVAAPPAIAPVLAAVVPAPAPAASVPAAPINPGAAALAANAGLVPELEARGQGKPLPADEIEKLKVAAAPGAQSAAGVPSPGKKPPLLSAPRGGKADDLKLIWGVAEKLEEKLNELGIWHFDQIARWTPEEVEWFEANMIGFKGRIERDKWIEQCTKLASGWRPESSAGERPKD